MIFAKWFASSVWVLASYALAAIAFVAVFVYWTTQNQEGSQIYDMIYSFLQGFGIGAESVYQKYLTISAIIGFFNACIFSLKIIDCLKSYTVFSFGTSIDDCNFHSVLLDVLIAYANLKSNSFLSVSASFFTGKPTTLK